jgi:hypothetical protein
MHPWTTVFEQEILRLLKPGADMLQGSFCGTGLMWDQGRKDKFHNKTNIGSTEVFEEFQPLGGLQLFLSKWARGLKSQGVKDAFYYMTVRDLLQTEASVTRNWPIVTDLKKEVGLELSDRKVWLGLGYFGAKKEKGYERHLEVLRFDGTWDLCIDDAWYGEEGSNYKTHLNIKRLIQARLQLGRLHLSTSENLHDMVRDPAPNKHKVLTVVWSRKSEDPQQKRWSVTGECGGFLRTPVFL